MPKSPLGIFKSIGEFIAKEELDRIPRGVRGIYVLFDRIKGKKYKVVYVGKSDSNVRGRLNAHAHSRKKREKWDCCSVFEVHNNITHEEIKELENLILFIFRKDPRTIGLNTKKSAKTFRIIRKVPMGA